MTASESTPPRLGCELNAHRDLGFCAFRPGRDVYDEVQGWRLLAIRERGVPPQPTTGRERPRQTDLADQLAYAAFDQAALHQRTTGRDPS